MEVSVIKVKPCNRGGFFSRKKNSNEKKFLLSLKTPDRTALKKESEEFIKYIKEKRSNQTIG